MTERVKNMKEFFEEILCEIYEEIPLLDPGTSTSSLPV